MGTEQRHQTPSFLPPPRHFQEARRRSFIQQRSNVASRQPNRRDVYAHRPRSLQSHNPRHNNLLGSLRPGIAPSPYDAAASVPASSHPLEARLKNWEATQDALRMNTLRTTYGLAEPVRRGMELKIVKDGE